MGIPVQALSRYFVLTMLLLGACKEAIGFDSPLESPARSILIRESTSAGNENAELRQTYDQALTTKLATLSNWLVRTESSAGTEFSEEERENQFKMLGVQYYLTSSIGIDRRERVPGGLELVVIVRLLRYPSGLIWKETFIGAPGEIDSFANEIAQEVHSFLGPAKRLSSLD